ncbi:hypothetical protein VC83_02535 [Pseudogymnoascus destructans]|uniref:VOC domain-containing protein n=1 Tax=Pseudogymnoascus destructans TaxID=655981 RepID=A0A177AIR2_9PEZI|nr:uncharacterized protein VC83_02535 [Pseudogymnoascus destructans]OAF61191.1 hypothetical protein VC83_02535 [Pseudogymnoascus destructans]
MSTPKSEAASSDASSSKVISPISLAHIVFRTANLQRQIDFWTLFLGATVVFQNDIIAFLQYDDEHHRIAFIADASAQPEQGSSKGAGMHHVAFTFASLANLVEAYKQRKAFGVLPTCPDEAREFMQGELFRENPLGTDFDPEELDGKIRSGVEDSVLKKRVEIGPRVSSP